MRDRNIIVSIILILGLCSGFLYLYKRSVSDEQIITNLDHQITSLQADLINSNKRNSDTIAALQETVNRQVVQQKSQSQLVTAAVSKVMPAVVSIVISKNIPQYKIAYENPFGNDPFFGNVGFQIPVYVPTGSTQSEQVAAGTGFLLNAQGYIITNRHVVSDQQASYTVLLSSGKQQTAKVLYIDPNNDVALIKIDGTSYPSVDLGDSSALQLGQTVIAIGNALGKYNNSVSVGVISGLNRDIQASDSANGTSENLKGIIQTDAAINPGNSGGPLLDINGTVVGINVATVQGSNNIGFTIPINTVKGIIRQNIK